MPADDLALYVRDVRRTFRSGPRLITAVDGLSIDVARGEVVGVLGPNGAGKTTTVKMAATLLSPTAGDIRVCGVDAVARPRRAREHLGLVLGGDRGFYLRATALENLDFFGELQGVSSRGSRRSAAMLDRVGLAGRGRDRVETFSRGMRQRLHIARALLANPSLVLLDEPSIGLDPEGAHDLRQLVLELADDHRGMLLTTHYLHEAEMLCDRLVVIADGQVLAQGTAHEIRRGAGVGPVTSVTATGPGDPARTVTRGGAVVDVASRHLGGVWTLDVIWSTRGADDELLDRTLSDHHVLSRVERPATLEETYLAFLRTARPAGPPPTPASRPSAARPTTP
ncbi:ABC transporter ATP-binding protein [Frigoribacterium sp. NBH87]|uniref:ABC transporter ATP-binding protein n=1 Tax=Frigoribacterium sp. NBH87 TaxID=2596916 RepID=UPI001629AFF0|nr:ABC transporter ATP-binding protein [Frigoribacterium sp. NBH87]QNE44296.1 ABC transporter ATP-binding protein [Frigoribacterium sp. NBH87]